MMMHLLLQTDHFQALLSKLRNLVEPESVTGWPDEQLRLLTEHSVPTWNIPAEYGGEEFSSSDQLQLYRLLASAALVTTFLLTQRNAACQRILTSANDRMKQALLAELCPGDQFATVGISHLTTSRQHLTTPVVTVTEDDGGFRLNGMVPWASGATKARYLVSGGTLADGRQILAALSTRDKGVQVEPPLEMMGLSSSQTGAVRLENVFVPEEDILHGPIQNVMSSGAGGGAGSLGTSAVAIGAAQGNLMRFAAEMDRRPELQEFWFPLNDEAGRLEGELAVLSEGSPAATQIESLRQRANSLAIRTAQAWLAATKGAGYVTGHPAERAVREAMFFLVWSCPRPVLEGNLREMSRSSCP
ncbi:MAG: acyl-CoA/acyl-ACP dehydrogenase [Planctomycetaceae bacterium]|nr:acyl-CoA/acyl-ACP dehydrogenase [Planctomycetaceae bacterium]